MSQQQMFLGMPQDHARKVNFYQVILSSYAQQDHKKLQIAQIIIANQAIMDVFISCMEAHLKPADFFTMLGNKKYDTWGLINFAQKVGAEDGRFLKLVKFYHSRLSESDPEWFQHCFNNLPHIDLDITQRLLLWHYTEGPHQKQLIGIDFDEVYKKAIIDTGKFIPVHSQEGYACLVEKPQSIEILKPPGLSTSDGKFFDAHGRELFPVYTVVSKENFAGYKVAVNQWYDSSHGPLSPGGGITNGLLGLFKEEDGDGFGRQ